MKTNFRNLLTSVIKRVTERQTFEAC